jgi:hypothetical protein
MSSPQYWWHFYILYFTDWSFVPSRYFCDIFNVDFSMFLSGGSRGFNKNFDILVCLHICLLHDKYALRHVYLKWICQMFLPCYALHSYSFLAVNGLQLYLHTYYSRKRVVYNCKHFLVGMLFEHVAYWGNICTLISCFVQWVSALFIEKIMKCKTANNIGKRLVSYSSFQFVLFVDSTKFFLFVSLFSGPAHILCLSVASGWNKERCIT